MPPASILFYQSRSKPTWEEVAVEGQGRSDLVSKGGRGGAYMGCFSPPSPPSPTQPTDPTSLLPNHLFFPLNVVYTELGKRRRLHNHRVSFLPLHPIPQPHPLYLCVLGRDDFTSIGWVTCAVMYIEYFSAEWISCNYVFIALDRLQCAQRCINIYCTMYIWFLVTVCTLFCADNSCNLVQSASVSFPWPIMQGWQDILTKK